MATIDRPRRTANDAAIATMDQIRMLLFIIFIRSGTVQRNRWAPFLLTAFFGAAYIFTTASPAVTMAGFKGECDQAFLATSETRPPSPAAITALNAKCEAFIRAGKAISGTR